MMREEPFDVSFWTTKDDLVKKVRALEVRVADLEDALVEECGRGSSLSIGDDAAVDALDDLNKSQNRIIDLMSRAMVASAMSSAFAEMKGKR